MSIVDRLGRAALFSLDPERAHALSITALKTGVVPPCRHTDPRLAVNVAGLTFPNPLGLAAGYDKNAVVPSGLLNLGFGFVEVGTVTPLAQAGNDRPRIFRLTRDHAVINRLGFNNQGHKAALRRLKHRGAGIIGVNIGANKESRDRLEDYRLGVQRFASIADYLTVNISSPNTPGLRGMQDPQALRDLLAVVKAERGNQPKRPPVFLKIAPDLDETALEPIARAVSDAGLDGIIISNTTLARNDLRDPQAKESGGLSGRPLFRASTIMLARMRQIVGPDLVLIGVGGVESPETAAEKIRAGADLVQLYTGLIYGGPGLPGRILRGLSAIIAQEGAASIADLRDTALERWAKGG